MTSDLKELVYEHDELAELDPPARRLALRELFVKAGVANVGEAVAAIADEIDGFGPITRVMNDPEVTDVLVNAHDDVWIERRGELHRAHVTWPDEASLERFAQRLVTTAGGRVDRARPIADARLADGSRVHVVLPPLARRGAVVSIRRFPQRRLTLEDLVSFGALKEPEADRLRADMDARRTIAISGGTGTGKTTLLNALLGCIRSDERVITIEETPELAPVCDHVVSLVARQPNVEGAGAIPLEELLRAALRMRPDRIVVGEVRGAEAMVALEALSTGHDGSLVTVHARSADEVVGRFVALALGAGTGASERSLDERCERAFDVIVHLRRAATRRVVSEVRRR